MPQPHCSGYTRLCNCQPVIGHIAVAHKRHSRQYKSTRFLQLQAVHWHSCIDNKIIRRLLRCCQQPLNQGLAGQQKCCHQNRLQQQHLLPLPLLQLRQL